MEMKAGKAEVNEHILEMVTGGSEEGYWDAKCTACGEVIGGTGIASFSWEKSEEKLSKYNKEGCPECGAKGTMIRIPFYIDW